MNYRPAASTVFASSSSGPAAASGLTPGKGMRSRMAQLVITVTMVAAVGLPSARAAVFEFRGDAEGWKAATPGHEVYAFDEDYPGCGSPPVGCLVCEGSAQTCGECATHDPVALPSISGGTATISAFKADTSGYCAIQDACHSCNQHSSAIIEPGGRVVLEFDPPIIAFYTYYGSLASSQSAAMKLYDTNRFLVRTLVTASTHDSLAIGHGFVSTVRIQKIEFTTTEDGGTTLGGYIALLDPVHDALGTVFIEEYGSVAALDLGVVFAPPCPVTVFPSEPVPGGDAPVEDALVHNVTQNSFHFSITEAIDAAVSCDVLEAQPGVYNELVDFGGKAITLRSRESTNPAIVAATIIDATGLDGSAVTCADGETSLTVLQGFTITGGTGSGEPIVGGGMRNIGSWPTVTDCTFRGNTADDGGGMYNEGSSPTVAHSTFSGNTADDGGGMYNDFSFPQVTNCAFRGNDAFRGGGMHNLQSSPTVTNSTFNGNTADFGGGIYNNLQSHATFTNCTIGGNTADEFGGGMRNFFSSPTVSNCIFWGDTPNEIVNASSTPTIAYSDIEGSGGTHAWNTTFGADGGGNIDADPLFVDPGYWDDNGTPDVPEDDSWVAGDYRLRADSLCIDAGDNTVVPVEINTDLDGRQRFVDDPEMPNAGNPDGINPIVDMGAYEVTVFLLVELASFTDCMNGPGSPPSPTSPTMTSQQCLDAFDFDNDGDVDLKDFGTVQGSVRSSE